MASLALGSIVSYQNDYWVALSYDGSQIKIIAPHRGQQKRSVSKAKCSPVDASPLVEVSYKGASYLVSTKGTIISLTTNRVMQWKDGNGDRDTILAIASDIHARADRCSFELVAEVAA